MPAASVPGRACPSRRTVVGAALVLPAATAAGCTLSGPEPERSPEPGAAPADPDVALLDDVAASIAALTDLYDAVTERHRRLRDDLAPLLEAHRAHEAALGQASPAGARGAGRRRGRRDRRARGRVGVPAREALAVRRLAETERKTSEQLLVAARRAASGGFAQLLASMSASCAQAVQVLGQVGGR
jgi:hypothetical protein